MSETAMIMDPIVFEPIYQERVWGGRALESRYGRPLRKDGTPFGESWEITDREGDESTVISPADFAGQKLGALWTVRREEIFGKGYEDRRGRFPLLVKILDARDRLSIQVHPPARVAADLGGEPKTEMWFIAAAEAGAVLYTGLKHGVSREDFERGIAEGQTEEQVHQIPVSAGEFIFIPSGRLHAIGAGLLIYEIQENSDTTYRVFDWNRVGLDGKPRQLHVAESLRCIDFDDREPRMGEKEGECLVRCPEFVVERWVLAEGISRDVTWEGRFAIVAVVDGVVRCGSAVFRPGDFFLVPAAAAGGVAGSLKALEGAATVLRCTLPAGVPESRARL